MMRSWLGLGCAVSVALLPACGEGTPPPPPDTAECLPASGVICTVAGTGIAGDGADRLPPLRTKLYAPADVAFDPTGRMFVIDWNNHRIRALAPDGTLQIVAGVGELLADTGTDQDLTTDRLNHPTDVTFDSSGRMVIAAWHNSRVKIVDLTTGEMTNSCGNGKRGFAGDGGPALQSTLNLPASVVFDPAGNLLISDQANQRIRRVDHLTGHIETIAGNGNKGFAGDGLPALQASFNLPVGQGGHPAAHIALDASDGSLYLADTDNHRIRRIDAAGIVSTFAGVGTRGSSGDGGPAAAAQLDSPVDVAVGPDGGIYIADTENNCVRVVRGGIIDTVAGTCHSCRESRDADCMCPGLDEACVRDGVPARQANLKYPTGIGFDPAGNLYVADSLHHRVRMIPR